MGGAVSVVVPFLPGIVFLFLALVLAHFRWLDGASLPVAKGLGVFAGLFLVFASGRAVVRGGYLDRLDRLDGSMADAAGSAAGPSDDALCRAFVDERGIPAPWCDCLARGLAAGREVDPALALVRREGELQVEGDERALARTDGVLLECSRPNLAAWYAHICRSGCRQEPLEPDARVLCDRICTCIGRRFGADPALADGLALDDRPGRMSLWAEQLEAERLVEPYVDACEAELGFGGRALGPPPSGRGASRL